MSEICFCSPEIINSYGGVQTYMRLIARALSDSNKLDITVSLKEQAHQYCNTLYDKPFFPAGNSKGIYLYNIISKKKRSKPVLFGHLNQAPLGFLLKKFKVVKKYGIVLHGIEAWQKVSYLKLKALQQADLIICTTPYTRDTVLGKNNFTNNNFKILPLALEPERFKASNNIISDGKKNIMNLLSVARLDASERYKGIDTCLKAVKELKKEGLDVSYNVIGDGNDKNYLENMALNLGITDCVQFCGKVSDEELDEYYKWSDLFLLPSEKEGFGLVYIEAMNYGLPVIAARSGGVPWVINEGQTGFLIDYGDNNMLADYIKKFYDTPLLVTLSRNAKKEVKERFSFSRFKKDLNKIIAEDLCVE